MGNRLSRSSTVAGITASSATYDANDRLVGTTYDDNGNTLSAGGITYSYDFANRLLSATGGISITYDGDGNRVAETAGGTTTTFLVDELNPSGYAQVVEELVGGVVQRTYTYGRDLISQNHWNGSTWTPSYHLADGLGSVRTLTDASGSATDNYTYDAFGSQIVSFGSTPNRYGFTGEQFDDDLGLYYLRARYYNQSNGRFLSRDTYPLDQINPREWNRYSYVAGDPVNAVDPSGKTLAGTVGSFKPSTIARPGVWITGLAVACVYKLTASIVGTALEIALFGGSMRASNLTNPCGVEREEKKTCNSPEYSGYVRCNAIKHRFYFKDMQEAIEIGRLLANNPFANIYNRKTLDKAICPSSGSHLEFREKPGMLPGRGAGKYYTSIGECPCCDDSSGTVEIQRRCGYFGDHDLIFNQYRR